MNFDHVALVSKDIEKSVIWYVNNWNAKILYQDETWALISIGKTKLAFVSPDQHPAHICFEIDDNFIEKKLKDKTFKAHRDGSSSCYLRDPDGNFLEFLYWPNKI
jgi:catechol 2,3-dioxygenase-like lactoylglutathione lyase family enzyme